MFFICLFKHITKVSDWFSQSGDTVPRWTSNLFRRMSLLIRSIGAVTTFVLTYRVIGFFVVEIVTFGKFLFL